MAPSKVVQSAFSVFFEYDTPKIVHIRSKKVGVINRFLQLTIIGYIIGYVIVYKKGYQDSDNVESSVTTKVKGIVLSNNSALPNIGKRTWDVADYVIPPQENNGFFVMTNVIATMNQTQRTCDGDPSIPGMNCTNDRNCTNKIGVFLPDSNGVMTGNCIDSAQPGMENQNVCEVFGWCYWEKNGAPKPAILEESANFTVFIKNDIVFPSFKVSRRNILDVFKSDADLGLCRWETSGNFTERYCPIFLLNDMLKAAHTDFDSVATKGAVIMIVIDWTCDLDYSVDECLPEYSFRRLDNPKYNVSVGFNFRYADHYSLDGVLYRNLYKAYGIRFLISVRGKAGKFSIVPLILNLASGLALLGVATILCDIVVLYFLKAKNFYRGKKYEDVKGQDAFEILEEDQDQNDREDSEVKRRKASQS